MDNRMKLDEEVEESVKALIARIKGLNDEAIEIEKILTRRLQRITPTCPNGGDNECPSGYHCEDGFCVR